MKQTKSLLGIIAGMFAVAFVMASCKTEVSIPNYTVTYSSVDYGTAPEAITVEENSILSEDKLPTLYAENAVFEGWYDGDTKAVPGEYQVKGNVTLTAHWVFSVTYTSEHGTVPDAITVEKNTVLSETQLPIRSYGTLVFKGWYDGETRAVPGEYEVTRNVTLTAHWAETATVSYSSKNGTVPESFDAELHQTLTSANLTPVTCSPYIFLGWYYGKDANNNGTGTQAQAGDAIDADVYLYAKWETRTVSYHSKFGTAPESFDRELNNTLTTADFNSISCSPYTFEGWYYSKDGDDNGTGTQAQAGDSITDNTDLYAKWRTATVSFSTEYDTNPASIKKYTGEKISGTEIPVLTTDGYTFGGWFNGSTKLIADYTVADDVTFNAKWTVNTYTITFDANGGTGESYSQTVTFGTTVKLNANTFSRDGWSFIGWNKVSDGSGTAYSNKANFAVTDASDITLYAQWDPNATASTVYNMIKNMTESGTIAVKGSISDDTISKIKSALDILRGNNSNILVSLDLSRTTGITKLGANAFNGCTNLKEIIIPNSVTSIDYRAFYSCTALKEVSIPNSVTSIGSYAFHNCTALTKVNIPNSVTSIDYGAFYSCTALTEVTIPNSVTTINEATFLGCSSLSKVTIPNSVTTIEDQAFWECTALTEVIIPSSVTTLWLRAFYGCSSLTSVTFEDMKSSWYQGHWSDGSHSNGDRIYLSYNTAENAKRLTRDYGIGNHYLYK